MAKVARYMPSGGAWVALGLSDYELGDKAAALADFRKAIELDYNVKRQFEQRGARLRAVLEDQEFVKQVLDAR